MVCAGKITYTKQLAELMEIEKQNAIEIGWTICEMIAELSFGNSFCLSCYYRYLNYGVIHEDFGYCNIR